MNLRAAVIGHPISHSLSPQVFSFIGETLGGNHRLQYEALDVESQQLEKFCQQLREQSEGAQWLGLNVTIPHKESILCHLDELAPEVQALGAANVVQVIGERLHGYNTDVAGIEVTLEKVGFACYGKTILVIGAGGAARATVYACAKAGAKKIVVVNRGVQRAQKLLNDLSAVFKSTEFSSVAAAGSIDAMADLVVQATPVGMARYDDRMNGDLANSFPTGSGTGSIDFPEIFRHCSQRALALDLIYRPQQTLFLQEAQRANLRAIGGLTMFVGQALATWQIWFGPLSARTREVLGNDLTAHLRDILRFESIQPVPRADFQRPIFLCGFMGVGKSATGRILSQKLACPFFDLDALIVELAGKSIRRIFSEDGEVEFRRWEGEALQDLLRRISVGGVCALGGGALISPENRRLIVQAGDLFYLKASPESLLGRLSGEWEERPLLKTSGDRITHLQNLLRTREPQYAEASAHIQTDNKSPSEVADEIIDILRGKVS
ncbi:MAG: hypothetical protein IPJ71_18190 [Bdellovibrionales bacterium]|nr:hypothetical protein [Bdellovibrionales bacterium]